MADLLAPVAAFLGCFVAIYLVGYSAGWLASYFKTIATIE